MVLKGIEIWLKWVPDGCLLLEFAIRLILTQFELQWSWKEIDLKEATCTNNRSTRLKFDIMWAPIRVTSGVSFSVLPPLLWKLPCFLCILALHQLCPYGTTMDPQGHNRLRNLKFNGWHLFWLDSNQMESTMLNLQWFRQWSWKESRWSWKSQYVPILTILPLFLNLFEMIVLKGIKISNFTIWVPYLSKYGCFSTGDWPNWLPMVGHTPAKTHVYIT